MPSRPRRNDADAEFACRDESEHGSLRWDGERSTYALDGVAALHGAGATGVARLELDGGGDRKNREGESDEGGGAGEHCR